MSDRSLRSTARCDHTLKLAGVVAPATGAEVRRMLSAR
jgi:hypothetical protein